MVDLDRSGHSCPIHLFSGLTERKKEKRPSSRARCRAGETGETRGKKREKEKVNQLESGKEKKLKNFDRVARWRF